MIDDLFVENLMFYFNLSTKIKQANLTLLPYFQ